MPVIDAADLKPLSDAAQKAFQDWIKAGRAQALARERGDVVGEDRARRAAQQNEMIYNVAARDLATHVNAVLAKHQLGYRE